MHNSGRIRGTNAFAIWDLSKAFYSEMMAREIASSVYLSGEDKVDWEIFLQNDGFQCQGKKKNGCVES